MGVAGDDRGVSCGDFKARVVGWSGLDFDGSNGDFVGMMYACCSKTASSRLGNTKSNPSPRQFDVGTVGRKGRSHVVVDMLDFGWSGRAMCFGGMIGIRETRSLWLLSTQDNDMPFWAECRAVPSQGESGGVISGWYDSEDEWISDVEYDDEEDAEMLEDTEVVDNEDEDPVKGLSLDDIMNGGGWWKCALLNADTYGFHPQLKPPRSLRRCDPYRRRISNLRLEGCAEQFL